MGKNLAGTLTSAERPAGRKDGHPLSRPADEEDGTGGHASLQAHREQQDSGKDGVVRKKKKKTVAWVSVPDLVGH